MRGDRVTQICILNTVSYSRFIQSARSCAADESVARGVQWDFSMVACDVAMRWINDAKQSHLLSVGLDVIWIYSKRVICGCVCFFG